MPQTLVRPASALATPAAGHYRLGMSSPRSFDAKRARLSGPNTFPRFAVEGGGVPLAEAGLASDEWLIIAARGDAALAFVKRQLAYHHVAQGELRGHKYLVSF